MAEMPCHGAFISWEGRHLAASAVALSSTKWVLISIENSVNLHSDLAHSATSILQQDGFQAHGNNATLAAQSQVTHQLSLPNNNQIIPLSFVGSRHFVFEVGIVSKSCHRITKTQNSRGMKGPLGVIWSSPLGPTGPTQPWSFVGSKFLTTFFSGENYET